MIEVDEELFAQASSTEDGVQHSKLARPSSDENALTFVDLFAGCGGLSEGFYRLGYRALAHVEIDHWACETLRRRMEYYGYSSREIAYGVIEKDITSDDIIVSIDKAVRNQTVDVIIGGPPCQAYSTAGRVRDSKKMAEDPRNFLFESYVRILEHYQPKYFVFENVVGLLSAKVKGQLILPQIFSALGRLYHIESRPDYLVHNTAEYGVPQMRKRVIILGKSQLEVDEKNASASPGTKMKFTFEDIIRCANACNKQICEENQEKIRVFREAYDKLVMVHPRKTKFKETVLDLHFYELMRLYSNALEKTNSCLFVAGFSFADEHIAQITLRAASSNPTLQIIIFAYNSDAKEAINKSLGKSNNDNILILSVDDFKESQDETDKTLFEGLSNFDLTSINQYIFDVLRVRIY